MTDLIRVFVGDSNDVLKTIPDGTYTAVVTDPPYGLSAPPNPADVLVQWLLSGDFVRTGGRKKAPPAGLSELAARFAKSAGPGGFLGNSWDSFVPGPSLWSEVYRVCRPGAMALVFAGTRTMDWMMLSLRLAGFEIIDVIAWVTAQGMAKAGTIDKRIDDRAGVTREVVGVKTYAGQGPECYGSAGTSSRGFGVNETGRVGDFDAKRSLTLPASDDAREWDGWSTQLAPGYEPIIVARRPCEGTAVGNVLAHGCGAMNIKACLIGGESTRRHNKADIGYGGGCLAAGVGYDTGSDSGRWSKNIMLDEAAADILDAVVGERTSGSRRAGVRKDAGWFGNNTGDGGPEIVGSTGGPSRFFWVGPCAEDDDLVLPFRYVPKVRFTGRVDGLPEGLVCKHPCKKPEALMRWLCRLVGHPRGRILDPFAGSGSTLAAARAEGLPADGVEREPDYARVARIRAGVARLADFRGLPPLRLPTDPASALAEWLLDRA